MKITDIRFVRVSGTWDYQGPVDPSGRSRPENMYPDLKRSDWTIPGLDKEPPYQVQGIFLYIDTDQDVSGVYGPVQDEDVHIIQTQLARVVIGEHPHAIERIWDKMYRTAIHGRKGPTMMAISKVDMALWDLKGKLFNAPVYELLGGPSREQIRVYASMLGYSVEPEAAARRAKEITAEGYTASKWFFAHDMSDGEEGVRQNLALIQAVREAVGPDSDLMFDAWNGWNVPYTQRMVELAREYRPWWFEEPVMPDLIPQYAKLRRSVSGIAISGGEHEYTRWGIKALLDAGAVDILQPDPNWAGGISELVKICALASAYDIPVVPHHGGWASSHIIASQTLTTCPIQEFLLLHGGRGNVFYKNKVQPKDGYLGLPPGPGLGIELDEAAIESREEWSVKD